MSDDPGGDMLKTLLAVAKAAAEAERAIGSLSHTVSGPMSGAAKNLAGAWNVVPQGGKGPPQFAFGGTGLPSNMPPPTGQPVQGLPPPPGATKNSWDPQFGGGGGSGPPPPGGGGGGGGGGGMEKFAMGGTLAAGAMPVVQAGFDLLPDAAQGVTRKASAQTTSMISTGSMRYEGYYRNAGRAVMGHRMSSVNADQAVGAIGAQNYMGPGSGMESLYSASGWAYQSMGMTNEEGAQRAMSAWAPQSSNYLMSYFGISTTDAQGNRRKLTDISRDLHSRLSPMVGNDPAKLDRMLQANPNAFAELGESKGMVMNMLKQQMVAQNEGMEWSPDDPKSEWSKKHGSSALKAAGHENAAQTGNVDVGADASTSGYVGMKTVSAELTQAFTDLYKSVRPLADALQFMKGSWAGLTPDTAVSKGMTFVGEAGKFIGQFAGMGKSAGSLRVSGNQQANIHDGEMILPARVAERVRSDLRGGTGQAASSGGISGAIAHLLGSAGSDQKEAARGQMTAADKLQAAADAQLKAAGAAGSRGGSSARKTSFSKAVSKALGVADVAAKFATPALAGALGMIEGTGLLQGGADMAGAGTVLPGLSKSSSGSSGSGSGGSSPSAGAYKGSDNVERWRPTVLQVLKDLGLPLTYADGVLRQINQESSGVPDDVNDYDSNWAKGYASFGLLQTIAPTYQSWAPPGRAGTIETIMVKGKAQQYVKEMVDPYNNIYAGVNYAVHRYGIQKLDAWNAGRNQAYSEGTLRVNRDQIAQIHANEMILPSRVAESVRTEMRKESIGQEMPRQSGGPVYVEIKLANASEGEAIRAARVIQREIRNAYGIDTLTGT